MMIIEDRIEIKSSRETVWEATVDVESWPQWSPVMQKIIREDSGEFAVGNSALINQKMMPETRWTVIEINPGCSFSWQAHVLGMDMIASHLIVEGVGQVSSILRIQMKGPLIRLLGPVIRRAVLKSLKEENRGLKRFCEAQSPPLS